MKTICSITSTLLNMCQQPKLTVQSMGAKSFPFTVPPKDQGTSHTEPPQIPVTLFYLK
jgi:hypothetical protein